VFPSILRIVRQWIRSILQSGGGFVQSRRFQMMEPSSSPARTLSSQRIFSRGDRVQLLGLPGVRHAADGVGGMLGLASNGLDTLDAVRLDEAGRRGTTQRCTGSGSLAAAVRPRSDSSCRNGPRLVAKDSGEVSRLTVPDALASAKRMMLVPA
jgi:hypothetical protein